MVDKPAIQQDATPITVQGDESPEDAFYRAYKPDAEKPSEEDEEEGNADTSENDEDGQQSDEVDDENLPDDDQDEDGQEDDEDGKQEADSGKKIVIEAEAEAFVKHKVDGKEVEIPVKDLARLYGQEASLTRKSQETAELRKHVEDAGVRYGEGMKVLYERALERYKPYQELNFLALAKDPDVSSEEVTALQEAAKKAYEDVTFLSQELEQHMQKQEQQRVADLRKRAVETWTTLSDPNTGIKGWDEKTYNNIRDYAKKQGLVAQLVDELVDPTAFRILHKAMLYDNRPAVATKTVKVDKTPKRIIKSAPLDNTRSSNGRGSNAMQRLRSTGSVEDAAAAFLDRLQD